MSYPIILTGTIDSSVYNNEGTIFKDCNERLSQYETAINRYITESIFDKIVFIDNSNYDFNYKEFEVLAERYSKKFEFIKGEVCVEKILKHGKSYGDGNLIYEALSKSKLLQDENIIYKCTGRIFLLNSNNICTTKDKSKNEFIIYENNSWCLTNFFKFNKDDYLKHLVNAYKECTDNEQFGLEQAFYVHLKNAKDLEISCFSTYPRFTGIQGLTGNKYSGSKIEMFARNILIKLGAFSLNSKFSSILSFFMKLKHGK